MPNVLVNDESLKNIADAIRAKGGNGLFKPAEMGEAIMGLPSGGGPSPSEPLDPVEVRKQKRDSNWPFIPLPNEMADSTSPYYEENDCIYMLYDARGELNACFDIGGNVNITIHKWMNTNKVSESVITAPTDRHVKLHFTPNDSDFDTYNFVMLVCRSASIDSINLYVTANDEKGNHIYRNINRDLFEVSGNTNGHCQYLTASSDKNRFNEMNKLTFFGFDGISENTTNMSYMFSGCSSLTSIPLLDTHSVTNMNNMFSNCYSLTSIPLLDTHSVTNMAYMFSHCSSLTSIPLLDTHSVTNMAYMFSHCSSLTSIPLLDTRSVKNMESMFYICYSLTSIPQLDTSSVTNMNYMFNNCNSLTSIPQLDTSSVTKMNGMFSGCSSLTSIPVLDTHSVTNMANLFSSCSSLTSILLSFFNLSSTDNSSYMFYNCYRLNSITINSFGTNYMFNENAFSSCYPILGTNTVYHKTSEKDGFIYVPSDMVDTLKAADGWSKYASQIVPIAA